VGQTSPDCGLCRMQWQNGHHRFKELRRRGVPKFQAPVAPVRRRGSGACPDTRRSNRPCATTISTHSVYPDSMSLPKPNPVEPLGYGTRIPGGRGGAARYPPIPINTRYTTFAEDVNAAQGTRYRLPTRLLLAVRFDSVYVAAAGS